MPQAHRRQYRTRAEGPNTEVWSFCKQARFSSDVEQQVSLQRELTAAAPSRFSSFKPPANFGRLPCNSAKMFPWIFPGRARRPPAGTPGCCCPTPRGPGRPRPGSPDGGTFCEQLPPPETARRYGLGPLCTTPISTKASRLVGEASPGKGRSGTSGRSISRTRAGPRMQTMHHR